MADEPTRFQLLRHSYLEVLDNTKHQDDKIGRFLTAIAFLIAGVLVFADPRVLGVRYLIGGHKLPLPAIALICFLVLIVLAVLFFIFGLSAPLTRPGGTGGRSHLFFLMIAGETEESWRTMWPHDSGVRNTIECEYREETLNLARRADRKYSRSIEASALFILALLFFLLGLVLSVESLAATSVPTAATSVLTWSLRLRLEMGAILASFVFALTYQEMRRLQKPEDRPRQRELERRLAGARLALCAYPIAAGSVAAAAGPWWLGIVAASGVLAITGFCLMFADESKDERKGASRLRLVTVVIVGLALLVPAVIAVTMRRFDLQLLVAILALAPFVFGSFWQSSAEWKRRNRVGVMWPCAGPAPLCLPLRARAGGR